MTAEQPRSFVAPAPVEDPFEGACSFVAAAPVEDALEAPSDSRWATPAIQHEPSEPFRFQHLFAKDNPGHILDFYDVEEELGTGTFGSVFKLHCRTTGVRRAAKQMPYEKVKDPIKYEREICIAKQLDHPNLVRLYEVFRGGRYLYLVMELCTGGELFDRISQDGAHGLREIEAAGYVRQMLAALCYLHTNSFAHRDVKPENFMLQSAAPDAALKLIDFGLACRFTPGKPMHTKAGTAYYVAPEVLAGSYDELCDVWSAGVVAYILLCGYPPFNGSTDKEVLKHVQSGILRFHPRDWEKISPSAVRLIRRMLDHSPDHRTTAGLALKSSWLHRSYAPAGDRAEAIISDGSTRTASDDTIRNNLQSPPALPQLALDRNGTAEVVSRLKDFQRYSRLKRVGLTAIAQQLSDEETVELQEIFRDLDTNGDGVLSPEEVRLGLERVFGVDVPHTVEDILRTVDSDGSGCLDYTEFVAATMDRRLSSKRELCLAAFRAFDLDGNGRISQEELLGVLGGASPCSSGGGASPDCSPGRQGVQGMIREADTNGDGCIDFEEFFQMMSNAPEAGAAPPAPGIMHKRPRGATVDNAMPASSLCWRDAAESGGVPRTVGAAGGKTLRSTRSSRTVGGA